MDLITESIQDVSDGRLGVLLAIAALILVATFVFSRLATKALQKIMRVDGLPLPSSSILVNIMRATIWVLGLSVVLSSCFKVDVNGLIAAIGVGGVALSLGMQDTIKNFIGGLQITLMGIVRPGDHVVIDGVEGIVQDVTWRQTTVKDYDNNVYLIPNAKISETTVTKISPSYLVATMLSFTNDGRDLDELIPHMEALAKAAVEQVAPLEKDPWILLTQIGEYGTWAKMRFVLKDITHAREARDAALRAVSPYTRNDARDILAREKELDKDESAEQ